MRSASNKETSINSRGDLCNNGCSNSFVFILSLFGFVIAATIPTTGHACLVTVIIYRIKVVYEMAMLVSASDTTTTCRVTVHCLCEGQNVLDHCAQLLLNKLTVSVHSTSLHYLHRHSRVDAAARRTNLRIWRTQYREHA